MMSSFAKAIGTANLLCVGQGGWRRCGVLGGGEETVHLGEAQEMLHFLPSRCCWAWLRNLLALAPLCLVLLGNVMALSCSTCHITCDKYMHTRLSANYAKWVHTCVSYGVAHARGLYLMSCHVMSCHVMSCHLYTEMQRRRGHSKIQRRRGHSKIQRRRGQERRQDKAAPSSSHRATSGSRTRAHLPTRAHISPPHHTRCQEPEGISRHPHHTKTMRGGGRRGEDRTGERRGERRIGWHVMACDATSHVMTSHRMHRHILSHRIQHSQHATHRGKQHATQGGKEHAN